MHICIPYKDWCFFSVFTVYVLSKMAAAQRDGPILTRNISNDVVR